MKRLTFIIIGAALLWSGFWFWQATLQKQQIEHWFEARRAQGWAADYSEISILGFPNRLDTTLTQPRLGDPESGLVWSSPFLQLFRLSYNPSHIIAIWADTQRFATPYSETTVETASAQASVRFSDVSNWVPERIIFATEAVTVSSDKGWNASAETAQLSLEAVPDTDTSYRIAVDIAGLFGLVPGVISVSGASGSQPPIDRMRMDIDVTLSAPLSRTSVESGRPQLERIGLNIAEVEWSGLRLAAAGQLNVSQSGTPDGTLTLKIRNWRDMLDRERDAGRLTQSAFGQIDFILTLISGLSGNPDTLDLPFDFKQGKVWLGPLMLGNAPRLAIP